jgi:GT2 family glycosyltransferase
MSMQAPDVSVIIVNWNTRDLLRNAIRSVVDETSSPHEIIVIDNSSADGSADMVRREFPQVVLIANTDNKGFAAANNQGLRIAKGKNLLLLNPDTVILDKCIDKSLSWLATRPDVGCMGAQAFDRPGVIQRTCFADPGPINSTIVEFGLLNLGKRIKYFGKPWYTDWNRDVEKEVDVVTGAYMLVPRAVFEKLGFLDEAFFIYTEEADWCRRIRNLGYKCVFAPVGQFLHLDGGGKSTTQVRSRMHVELQRSKLIYIQKHYGWLATQLTRMMYAFSSAMRASMFGVLSTLRGTDLDKARLRLAKAALGYHLLNRQPVK